MLLSLIPFKVEIHSNHGDSIFLENSSIINTYALKVTKEDGMLEIFCDSFRQFFLFRFHLVLYQSTILSQTLSPVKSLSVLSPENFKPVCRVVLKYHFSQYFILLL